MEQMKLSTPATADQGNAWIYLALELSTTSWVVVMHTPLADKLSRHRLEAGDTAGLGALIERLREKVGRRCGGAVAVVSCYEAGRDGFWVHRWLLERGVVNHVIDPASLQVNRRARRKKTDRLDAEALVRALMAYSRGEHQVCSMVRVPSVEQEDAKRPHRARERLVQERVRYVNCIKGLLATQGCAPYEPRRRDRHEKLAALRTGTGAPLPPYLLAEIRDLLSRLEGAMEQIERLEDARDAIVMAPAPAAMPAASTSAPANDAETKIRALTQLKAIGPQFATLLVHEVYYRSFANRREVAGYTGLTPTPWQSGTVAHDQGISKAGNARARTAFIELAWLWRRHQPDSAITRWFVARVGTRTGRERRIAIVAVARKLAVALWRYLETGLVPVGAALKKA